MAAPNTLKTAWDHCAWNFANKTHDTDDTKYSPDQLALLRHAFYGGARGYLTAYLAQPDGRDALLHDLHLHLLRTAFDISALPPPGPLLAAWEDLSRDGRFATPWDVKLHDLYRSTFYVGALAVKDGARAATLLMEATVYLEKNDPHPVTQGPENLYETRTFADMWDDLLKVTLGGFKPDYQAKVRHAFYAGARALRRLPSDEVRAAVNEVEAYLIAKRFGVTRTPPPGPFAREVASYLVEQAEDGRQGRLREVHAYLGAMALSVLGDAARPAELNSVLN